MSWEEWLKTKFENMEGEILLFFTQWMYTYKYIDCQLLVPPHWRTVKNTLPDRSNWCVGLCSTQAGSSSSMCSLVLLYLLFYADPIYCQGCEFPSPLPSLWVVTAEKPADYSQWSFTSLLQNTEGDELLLTGHVFSVNTTSWSGGTAKNLWPFFVCVQSNIVCLW